MTGHMRWGMSLNGAISTTLGSTRISFTMSGRWRYITDMMIVLMHTDLPEPVVPAIRQWGMAARSVMSGSPLASLPRNSGIDILFIASGASCISSFNRTFSFCLLGSSLAMVLLTGVYARMG